MTDEIDSQRAQIRRSALGFAVYAGAFGMTFGAVSTAAGLNVAQTMVLSAVMLTGASQFAFVGVVGAGGAPLAAVSTALLLGLRNTFYGVPVTSILRPRGARRWIAAHFVIDETTAMAVAQDDRDHGRFAFWVTGISLASLWIVGSLAGALLGARVDPDVLGLDAAAPAVFLALLWPQLRLRGGPSLAAVAAAVTVALIPLVPTGVPVIAAAVLAVVAGSLGTRPDAPASEDTPASLSTDEHMGAASDENDTL